MGIHLFEHNQKAYDAAVLMMEAQGKAAVIHPTGTGKSFIAFKLAEEHLASQICWLSPSEYIYRTQLENLKTTLPGEKISFPNIQYLSYSRLMKNERHMNELKPDYIVLDEFHRCGAANDSYRKDFEIYALGRNKEKLTNRFGETHNLHFVVQDVTKPITVEGLDFIIHTVSNADPKSYALYPAETILINIIGAKSRTISYTYRRNPCIMGNIFRESERWMHIC